MSDNENKYMNDVNTESVDQDEPANDRDDSHITDDRDKFRKFRSNLKKHLSNEYLILSERKDELESDATQINVEIERRDRTLFPGNEHGDSRKYFSPLNLSDIKNSENSEKEKELNKKLDSINKEIDSLEQRMSEIMDFLKDVDQMLVKPEKKKMKISSNMRENIDSLTDYYLIQNPSVEIVNEYNSKREEFSTGLSEYILSQIMSLINIAIKSYDVSLVLLEFSDMTEDDQDYLTVTMSYDCERKAEIESSKIVFQYSGL